MGNTHKIVLSNKREIEVSAERLKSFENNQVNANIVYSTLDYELWNRKKGKLTKGDYKVFDKTIDQFYTEHYKVPSQADKRKKDIVFGELHNEDGSPIAREDRRGKEPSELTIALRSIILTVLKNKQISDDNLTLFDWLKEFYIINDIFYKDYKEYKSNTYSFKLVDGINKNEFPFDVNSLTKEEKRRMVKQYFNNTVEFLKDKLVVTLRKLESDGLIFLQNYMVGARINELEDKRYISHELLSPNELAKLKKLEISIKEELKLHHLIGKRLYFHDGFKKELNKRLATEGLKTKGSHYYYEFVYNTYSISKVFTDEQLTNYINRNTYIKNAITIEEEKFIHSYKKVLYEAICKKIDRASDKYKSEVAHKINKKTIGNAEGLIESKHSRINTYNELNKQFVGTMLIAKHKDNLPKLLNLEMLEDIQLNVNERVSNKSSTTLINENDLPF